MAIKKCIITKTINNGDGQSVVLKEIAHIVDPVIDGAVMFSNYHGDRTGGWVVQKVMDDVTYDDEKLSFKRRFYRLPDIAFGCMDPNHRKSGQQPSSS